MEKYPALVKKSRRTKKQEIIDYIKNIRELHSKK
jgi:hypothetical protein